MQLEIVSPEKTIFSGEAKSVHLPGSEGYFQVLNNHAPIVSTLKKGEILIDGVDHDLESDVLDFSTGRASSSRGGMGVILRGALHVYAPVAR